MKNILERLINKIYDVILMLKMCTCGIFYRILINQQLYTTNLEI